MDAGYADGSIHRQSSGLMLRKLEAFMLSRVEASKGPLD
jgi:hypothetical protein